MFTLQVSLQCHCSYGDLQQGLKVANVVYYMLRKGGYKFFFMILDFFVTFISELIAKHIFRVLSPNRPSRTDKNFEMDEALELFWSFSSNF